MECDSRHCHFCCQRYENKMVCLWAVLCVCVWCACVCDCVRQNSLRSTYTTPTWNAILALENIRCIWVSRDNIHEPIKWSALSRQMPRSLVSTMYNTVPHIAQCSTVRDMKHKYTEVNKYYLYVSLCIIQQWKKKTMNETKKGDIKTTKWDQQVAEAHTQHIFFSLVIRVYLAAAGECMAHGLPWWPSSVCACRACRWHLNTHTHEKQFIDDNIVCLMMSVRGKIQALLLFVFEILMMISLECPLKMIFNMHDPDQYTHTQLVG